MKIIFSLFFIFAASAVFAQPKLISQATITTKTTIVAPEGEEEQSRTFTSEDGQERTIRFNRGDGETKTVTTLKNEMVKTFSESDMGRTTLIRDNAKKITTTIMEIMGKKTGYYATDEEQEQMAKRIDSMMQSRNQQFSFGNNRTATVFKTEYIDASKKIAGYTCKKALVIGTRANNKTDTTVVWYCPDFKLQHISSTGGSLGGFAAMTAIAQPTGMEDLNGFPMEYEKNMSRGRKMTVQVTKLVIDKEVADKEFEISKDIELKAMKDMQNGGGPGGMRIVVGG
ncbi:MAG TPA: hypothetical protein PK987_00950 [Ferruginibacter sp.]|nr:hypothetical protein [Ferruginibacter sp.]